MQEIQVVKLKMVKEQVSLPVEKISFPQDVSEVLKWYIGDSDRENMVVISLDARLQITCIHTASIGTVSETVVHPREIFKVAILTNASSIIIGHNHPAGSLMPSNADIEATKRIAEAGKVLGISLLDHIIVTDSDYISLKEKGYL